MANNVNRNKRLLRVRPRSRHTGSTSTPAPSTLPELWPVSDAQTTPEWGPGQLWSQPMVVLSKEEIIASAVRQQLEQMMPYVSIGLCFGFVLGLMCVSSAESNRRN
jgi:hypothetical protein